MIDGVCLPVSLPHVLPEAAAAAAADDDDDNDGTMMQCIAAPGQCVALSSELQQDRPAPLQV
jgi:hypothetical protein